MLILNHSHIICEVIKRVFVSLWHENFFKFTVCYIANSREGEKKSWQEQKLADRKQQQKT